MIAIPAEEIEALEAEWLKSLTDLHLRLRDMPVEPDADTIRGLIEVLGGLCEEVMVLKLRELRQHSPFR
jgi:hypothetical protein